MDKSNAGFASLMNLLRSRPDYSSASTRCHAPNPRNEIRGFRQVRRMKPMPTRLAEKDIPHQGEREKARRVRQLLKRNETENVREG